MRFFFHLVGNDETIWDDAGVELEFPYDVPSQALKALREMARAERDTR